MPDNAPSQPVAPDTPNTAPPATDDRTSSTANRRPSLSQAMLQRMKNVDPAMAQRYHQKSGE